MLDGFLQTNASHAASAALVPLWEWDPPPISNCFNVVVTVVESSDVFKFKQIKLFRTKRLLVDVEPPLMKRGENSCPYPQISLFFPHKCKRMLTGPVSPTVFFFVGFFFDTISCILPKLGGQIH